jgi:(hydroxyamino)benzene mutase
VKVFHSPRLALSAHIAAVQNGMVLLLYGLLWFRISLSVTLEKMAYLSAVAGMYLIRVGFTLAAMTGASKVLKFSGAGYSASNSWEFGVGATIYAGSGAAIVAGLPLLVGLLKLDVTQKAH